MANAPTALPIPPPPPLPFTAPPLSAAQITILTSPPPPFPGPPSSVDLSPLEFLLALIAVVTIPALIYTFIFAFKCPSRRRQPDESSGAPSAAPSVAASEAPHDVGDAVAPVSDLKYRKDTHVKEIGSECPVCLSVFTDGEEVRQLSGCKHSFHGSCIDLWLSNHSNCPVCRATVPGKRQNSSAPAADHDLQQGLPDASGLV